MAAEVHDDLELPEYHERLLIVRSVPTAPSIPLSLNETMQFGPAAMRPFIERGVVRRIVSVGNDAAASVLPAGVIGAELHATQLDPLSRFSVIELGEHHEPTNVIQDLERTGQFISVSQVPLRFMILPQFLSVPASDSHVKTVDAKDDRLWNHERIQLDSARAESRFNEPVHVRVAVLDTGIDPGHPDLRDRIQRYSHHKSLEACGPDDIQGHGTHVAGTIAGASKSPGAARGICECQLYIWKVFSDQPRHFPAIGLCLYAVDPVAYRTALAECLDQGMDVVNLSLGGAAPLDAMEYALFSSLLRSGSTVVAAMGNLGSYSLMYPAAHQGVVAVGATNHNDEVAAFSNRGSHIAMCAPGTDVWSSVPTYPGHRALTANPARIGQSPCGTPVARPVNYSQMSGTSMACAHVAGAAAALLGQDFERSGPGVRERLLRTSDGIAESNPGLDETAFGAGRLNVRRLLWD